MATLKNLKVGQSLWIVRKTRMGNTSISTDSLYEAKVIEVDVGGGYAMISVNGNKPSRYSERNIKQMKVKKPEKKSVGAFGNVRY